MPTLKNLTILHSNDMHGDFLAEQVDDKLVGGLSMLSGYVSKVRNEVENSIYCIAGDMLQGSIIDSDYKGLSTIEIMNMLAPDIATIGNHEIDYGLAHLLFLERCAKFPIVNANFYIKNPFTRLFTPQAILEIDDMNIMFIGITTIEIMNSIQNDYLGSFVSVEEAAREVGRICNAYRNIDIDFTVLLTHIGFEEDLHLAELLDPEWGVDLIIGGHSHTMLDEPAIVNNILIAQAGVGTNQLGRFDIVIDTDTNDVYDYKWELIQITPENCPRDHEMEETIARFKDETDLKYDRVLCRLQSELTHPDRYQETELGNLFADILQEEVGVDIMFVGSGSIRKKYVSTLLQLREFIELFPYDDKVRQVVVTGSQLKQMVSHIFREEMFAGNHTEFYQYSKGTKIVYDRAAQQLISLELNGEAIDDQQLYSLGLQEFHYSNFESFFSVTMEDVTSNARPRVVATSIHDVMIEHLGNAIYLDAEVEGRIEVLNM